MESGLFALLGLFVGGVLNAVVDRSPPHDYVDGVTAEGARPRSIRYWEWLPLFSAYGAAKSRRVPYPNFWLRYPLVELTTAALQSAGLYLDLTPAAVYPSRLYDAIVTTGEVPYHESKHPNELQSNQKFWARERCLACGSVEEDNNDSDSFIY